MIFLNVIMVLRCFSKHLKNLFKEQIKTIKYNNSSSGGGEGGGMIF